MSSRLPVTTRYSAQLTRIAVRLSAEAAAAVLSGPSAGRGGKSTEVHDLVRIFAAEQAGAEDGDR